MATKKAQKPAKKRKAQSVAPKEPKRGQLLGTVAIPVQTYVTLTNPGVFNELVIEWGCLGLSEEPDKITETSGNNRLLDPKKPITTSEEGLHVYFDPPLTGSGTYGFQFLCTYNEAAEAKSEGPEPKEDDEQTFEQIEGEKYAPANAEA